MDANKLYDIQVAAHKKKKLSWEDKLEVVRLRDKENYTFKQIAKKFDRHPSTIQALYVNVLRTLSRINDPEPINKMTIRSANILENLGYRRLRYLKFASERELLEQKNCGMESLKEIRNVCKNNDIQLLKDQDLKFALRIEGEPRRRWRGDKVYNKYFKTIEEVEAFKKGLIISRVLKYPKITEQKEINRPKEIQCNKYLEKCK